MNPIQKAWLKVLTPFQYLINEKLAKRSGVFGKLGRFFLIGPREYGMHPINKLLIFLNRRYMYGSAFLLHRYSYVKTLTHGGYQMIRPFKSLTFFGPLAILVGLLRFVYFTPQNRGYEPDKITYLARRIGGQTGLPLNSLNQRTSAHYIEINYIYGAEMVKKYHRQHKKIIEDRNRHSEEERKSKYADPSYKYVPRVACNITDSSMPL